MDDAELFDLALGVPAQQREAALRRGCGGNEDRVQRILALLAYAGDAARFDASTNDESTAAEPARCREGELIGRYEVRRFLGQGSFGQVYEVYDLELRRAVALKLLRDDRASDADLLRFRREAQSLAQIDHPNVVRVYDVGSHGARRYIAMELIDGVSLREWLTGPHGERPWQTSLDTLLPAARGLQAAHAAGIVHRDFKPENVMIERGGRVVVTDFGIARMGSYDPMGPRAGDDTGQPASRPGATASTASPIGTLRYMAPEQFHGRATPRSDEYALCIVLVEALCPRDVTIPIDRVATESAPPRSGRAQLVGVRAPRWLRTILARGLAEDEHDRYPDVAALIDAIERARRRRRRGLALVVGALVAGPTSYALTRPAPQDCAQWDAATLSRGLEGTWTELEAAALAEPRSQRALGQVSRMRTQIEAGVASFASGRTATCERLAAGIIDAATARARDDCFARWHADTRRRVQWAVDHPAVFWNADLIAELPNSPDRCGYLELPAVSQPVLDPAVEQSIEDLLAQATDLRIQGDYEGSGRATEQVRALVEDVDHAGYRAEVLLRLGVLAAREREWDRAVALLREAAEASERSGMDALGAEVDTNLAETLALAPVPAIGEAETYLGLARAKLVRVGGGNAELDATQTSIAGHIAHGAGRYAEAEAMYRRAAEQFDALGPAARHSAAASRANIARAISMQGRHDEAIALAEAALAERIAVLGDEHPLVAADLFQLGLVHQNAAKTTDDGAQKRAHLESARADLARSYALIDLTDPRRRVFAAETLAQLTLTRLGLGRIDEVVAQDIAEIVDVFDDPNETRVDPLNRIKELRIARDAYDALESWEDARRVAARVVAWNARAPADAERRQDRLQLASYEVFIGDMAAADQQVRFLEATDPPTTDPDDAYAATVRELRRAIEHEHETGGPDDASR